MKFIYLHGFLWAGFLCSCAFDKPIEGGIQISQEERLPPIIDLKKEETKASKNKDVEKIVSYFILWQDLCKKRKPSLNPISPIKSRLKRESDILSMIYFDHRASKDKEFGDYQGACYVKYQRWGQKKILRSFIMIDYMLWLELDIDQKTVLLLHEIGHCILGRGHIEALPKDYKSIMRINILKYAEQFSKYKSEYMKELLECERP